MTDIYDEEALAQLEQEEHSLTEEALAIMFMALVLCRSDLEKELRAWYQKYGKDGVVTYVDSRKHVSKTNHQRRWTALLLIIHALFTNLKKSLSDSFRQMVEAVIAKEADFFEVDVGDPDLHWGADGEDWEERLGNDVEMLEAYIVTILTRSILQRKDIDSVIAQLGKRFESTESVLTALGISETTAVGSIAREVCFDALGIKDYKVFTRADERGCEICGPMHGLTFPITAYQPGVTASPFHPRCRCYEIPIRR